MTNTTCYLRLNFFRLQLKISEGLTIATLTLRLTYSHLKCPGTPPPIDESRAQHHSLDHAPFSAVSLDTCIAGSRVQIDLIHDRRHVGFAIIMQISYTLLRGQTTQVREAIPNILATQMICFTFIECLSPK